MLKLPMTMAALVCALCALLFSPAAKAAPELVGDGTSSREVVENESGSPATVGDVVASRRAPARIEDAAEGGDSPLSVPLRMPFQGFLTDAAGTPLGSGGSPELVEIVVEIHSAPVINALVWGPETHVDVPVENGVFAIELGGAGVPLSVADFAGGGPLWLDVTVEGETQDPRTPLITTPFAMHAYSADVAIADDGDWEVNGDDLTAAVSGGVGIGTAPSAKLDVLAGTGSAIVAENSSSGSTFTLRVKNNTGTAAVFEGPNTAGTGFPTTPACIYAPAESEDTGGFFTSDTGYAVLARVDEAGGVAVRGWDFGGNGKGGEFIGDVTVNSGDVTMSDRLGIGLSAPTHDVHIAHEQFTGDGGLILENAATANAWQLYTSQSSDDLRLFYNGAARGEFDATTGNYTSVSDARLKRDIEPMETMLEKVMALQPREYAMRDSADPGARHFGLIAQELETVFPEMVSTTPDDGDGIDDLKTVAYTEMISVLVKTIQEQQQQIADLERRVRTLER